MDGEYRGNLLYTSDSSLVICEGNLCYDWRTESVLSFSYSDIKKIVVMKEGKGGKGLGWGFLIGAAIGAVLPSISNETCPGPDSELCNLILDAWAASGIGIGGAILGGIIGVAFGIDANYHIDENINQFQSALHKLKKEAIFPSIPASVTEVH